MLELLCYGAIMLWFPLMSRCLYDSSPTLLRAHLAIGLDGDFIVALEHGDGVVGDLGTIVIISALVSMIGGQVGNGSGTYVKPLMRLNSETISPPWSLTCCLAFSRSSLEASLLRVTYGKS